MKLAALVLVLLAAGAAASSSHLRSPQAQLSVVAANVSEPSQEGSLPINLAVIADHCKCKFIGVCTCMATVDFMDCVADAGASGACEFKPSDFTKSCDAMAETCPTVGLQCTQEKATCLHPPDISKKSIPELNAELATLKSRKCNLEGAAAAGYLNAKARLAELAPRIQGNLDVLKIKGGEPFYMGCAPMPVGYKASWIGGEAYAPEPEPYSWQAAPAGQPASQEFAAPLPPAVLLSPSEKRGWIMFTNVSVYILLVLFCGILYDKVRKAHVYPQKMFNDGQFNYGIFGCFEDVRLSLMSCFCPALRWADSMDKAVFPQGPPEGTGQFLRYWPALLLFLLLTALQLYIGFAALFPFVGMAFGALLLVVVVVYRQRLRRKYSIEAGSFKSIFQDCMVWTCCPCCALVQEAREVESRRVDCLSD